MKDKLAGFIVKRRKAVLIFMVVLTTVVSLLMLGVHVNTDMTKYLPDGSSMKARFPTQSPRTRCALW